MTAQSRLFLDVGLFAALLAASNPAWTGLSVREWLSLAVVAPLLLQPVVNWQWTVRVACRLRPLLPAEYATSQRRHDARASSASYTLNMGTSSGGE